MKTKVSIPDALFDAAEEFADLIGVSRSELYSRALQSYVEDNLIRRTRDTAEIVETDKELQEPDEKYFLGG